MKQLHSLNSVNIVLASEATWRSNILSQLGIPHRCSAHKYNEPKFSGGLLQDFVKETATQKGQSIQHDFPEAIIISADQLISLNNDIFYKPGSREKAIEQLERLNGRRHKLVCAVSVIYNETIKTDFEEASLRMRQLTMQEIVNYVDWDKPWNCAGSYKIESLGASLFEEIQAKDPLSIIGIPGNLLLNILREMGFSNLI